MAQTLIRGSTQILDGSITAAKLASSLGLATSQLADGAEFLQRGGSVALTGDLSAGGNKITSLADATAAQDAVNLRTAQSLINGINLRKARVVAVANKTLSGLTANDGVTPSDGDVILLTAQSTASQNGPWEQHSGSWTRPSNWAAASTQKSTMFFIEEGTTYHDTKWIAITDAITVDSTSVTISQDLSGTAYTNGNGLSLTGATFAVKNGNGISFDGSSNVQVVGNSSGLITVNSSGVRITAGTSAQFIVANGSGDPAWVAMSGDVTIANTGAATVNHTAGTGFLKYGDMVAHETPSGAVNGSNTTYTLANTPQNSSVRVYVNGVLQEPGSGNDYTISGTTITMLYTLQTGDKIRVFYQK